LGECYPYPYPMLCVQECEILFESWGTTQKKVEFRWREDDNIVNKRIKLNQHEFTVTYENHQNNYSTGLELTLAIMSQWPFRRRQFSRRRLEAHLEEETLLPHAQDVPALIPLRGPGLVLHVYSPRTCTNIVFPFTVLF